MYNKLLNSANSIKEKLGDFVPEIALILGSGLGFMADLFENSIIIEYKDIPNFPVSTAPGHAGRLVFGKLGGKSVVAMQGRFHFYEGYDFDMVVFGIRVLKILGASTMIVTNASGGIKKGFKPGTIMLITDHIKFVDRSPLWGANIDELGVRFPDMSNTYTPVLRNMALKQAANLNIELQQGVYMLFTGPQYETPAEIRAAKVLGADAVGMSTVPEVIAARHAGMKILGFSLVCNMAAGLQNAYESKHEEQSNTTDNLVTQNQHELSEQEVLDAAEKSKGYFSKLILACVENI